MIRIAVLGDIGSGKSYFAKQLKIPLFCADEVVKNLEKAYSGEVVQLESEKGRIMYSMGKGV